MTIQHHAIVNLYRVLPCFFNFDISYLHTRARTCVCVVQLMWRSDVVVLWWSVVKLRSNIL